MNILDKIIAVVSPNAALKREGARRRLEIINSGYGNYGASRTKKSLIGWMDRGGSHYEDIEVNLPSLRQRSRDLYMGVPLATGALKTMRTNCVGVGLSLKSQVDYDYLGMSKDEAKALCKQIEREFSLWADSTACDLERLDNFKELQQLAFLNWLMSGDVVALLPTTKRVNTLYDLRIRLIEADRVSTPDDKMDDLRITSGVEKNDNGEVVAYHISSTHPLSSQDMTMETKWTRVKAYGKVTGRRNVLHVMNRERIGQLRGVPFLAPVIESLKQLGRYTDAELVAAVVSGCFTVFIQRETGSAGAFGEVVPEEQQVDTDPDSIEISPGAVYDLTPGEKIDTANPGRPNSEFDAFVTSICRQIGAALEIPFEMLVKHFTASYSASRAALLEAWKMFKMYRGWLVADFCQPIYEEWLTEAVAKGRIAAPGFFADPLVRKAYCKASWNGPAQGLLNPVQEVQAAQLRVTNGFSNRTRESMELTGTDYNDNIRQLRDEEEQLKEVKDIAGDTKTN